MDSAGPHRRWAFGGALPPSIRAGTASTATHDQPIPQSGLKRKIPKTLVSTHRRTIMKSTGPPLPGHAGIAH
ncbi:MAG TPA: hypothetical protein PLS67_06065, partial [Accumulibacter sp.]|nr:hypothetical protein [Accumulibacter sp.]